MKFKILIFALLIFFANTVNAATTGPYVAKIDYLQTTDVGDKHNTVFLLLDITDSPCASTNQHNRFTITNNVQHSTILSALMANKEITIHGTCTCNSSDIENIGNVRIRP